MLRIIEALVYLPEKDADRIIDSMKESVKQIRDRKEGKNND